MYLGGGIIHYNADKGDRLKTWKAREIPVSIVDMVIEMSSVALQWNCRQVMQTNRLDGSSYLYIVCIVEMLGMQ